MKRIIKRIGTNGVLQRPLTGYETVTRGSIVRNTACADCRHRIHLSFETSLTQDTCDIVGFCILSRHNTHGPLGKLTVCDYWEGEVYTEWDQSTI